MFRFKHHAQQDEEIGPSKGLMKWVNKFFRFILYPFIRPLYFFCFLVFFIVLIVSIPSYHGIQFDKIPFWYKQQFSRCYAKAQQLFDEQKKSPLAQGQPIINKGINVVTVKTPSKNTEMVDYDVTKQLNRKIFTQAQEVPVDVAKTINASAGNSVTPSTIPVSAPLTGNTNAQPLNIISKMTIEDIVFYENDNIGLSYLPIPKKVMGTAKVVNANEIKIDSQSMFLYGIYIPPYSSKGLHAQEYLEKTINDKQLECLIGAYTTENVPTAICIYDGISINHRLVELGYSKNVCLDK